MELIEAVKFAVEKALKFGANQADAYASKRRETSIQATNDKIGGIRDRRATSETIEGIGVRVAVGKSVAYAYTTILEEESILQAIKTAIKLAKVKEPDPDFKSLPPVKPPAKVEGIFDEAIITPPVDEAFEQIRKVLSEAMEANPNFNTVISGYSFTWAERAIANSLGVEVHFKESMAGTGVYIIGEREGLRSLGGKTDESRFLKEVDIEKCAEEAVKYAKVGLEKTKIEAGEKTVIFQPEALSSLMHYAFINAINAYNVQEGKSYLTGKLETQVASEKLTIIDDGTTPKGLRTAPVDGEGVPTRRNVIIDKGVLKSYLYDSYTGFKENRESTGNASRQFRSAVTVAPRNHIISGEEVKLEELLGEVKEGLLVRGVMGAHSTNIATGAFSVLANPAYVIRNGEIMGQIKGCMIAGTFQELLMKYSAQGDDVIQKGFLVAPSIKFEKVRIAL
ncbi:MAG: TldD/PmbA family protein [archaeon GB-1867-005]|nr:TldD/PmbA family protein [Candidatus Culexmicrobium cathedralense]